MKHHRKVIKMEIRKLNQQKKTFIVKSGKSEFCIEITVTELPDKV